MNKWIVIIAVAGALFGYQKWQQSAHHPQQSGPLRADMPYSGTAGSGAQADLKRAFEARQSNIQVEGEGVVAKTLPDDNKGSRHQRFILKLDGGQTVLVAHNIDLAGKIKGLKKGDTVGFNGEYEWSERGGVIHWTHRDPQGRHADGWLRHNGSVYQ